MSTAADRPGLAAADAPIGVFDSGVGGLTVLRALLRALPAEDFVYLGDTARLPYGTKSAESIRRYALQAAARLHAYGVKCLVIACNTASATALEALDDEFAPIPVLGVLEPGAAAACRATRNGRIAVIATDSTVRGGAYEARIRRRLATAQVVSRACPLLVALAEEGWYDGPIAHAVVHRYLDGMFVDHPQRDHPDTLVLGCTHFPVLRAAIRKVVGDRIAIVDSAETTAMELCATLSRSGLRRAQDCPGSVRLLATDGAERFARVGGIFLGRELRPADVEIVDLGNGGANLQS